MAKKKKNDLLYIMNPNCGWCKKADPVVEELVKEGYNITTLDITNSEEMAKASQIKSKHNLQCGTPLFIDADTGNSVCGFRPNEQLVGWAKGEKMPEPERKPAAPPTRPAPKRVKLEYIWLDGSKSKKLRSKVRYEILHLTEPSADNPSANMNQQIFEKTPEWSFDGSSTSQATTEDSDLILKPVKIYPNVMEMSQQNSQMSMFVFCEVYNTDGTPHESNSRHKLRTYVDTIEKDDVRVAFEQEFVFWNEKFNVPAGWEGNENPSEIFEPTKEGEYYCGLGGQAGSLRNLVDAHAKMCYQLGIALSGYNAEVLKSQWEYQTAITNIMKAADDLWISRFLLYKICESRGLDVSFDPKPVSGDYNGSGCHINFSTAKMREDFSTEYVDSIIEALALNHEKAISVYGNDNHKRLTGKNETSNLDEFTYGKSDRSASVRIPTTGNYIEDRRPAANIDPYEALLNLREVVQSVEESILTKA